MRLDPLRTWSSDTGAVRPLTTQLLAETYLAPRFAGYPLAETMASMTAPWSQSLAVAPDETQRCIARALHGLAAASPGLTCHAVTPKALPDGRARHHLTALRDLWALMDDALPEDLAVLRLVLNSTAADALIPLPLLSNATDPHATPAEAALHSHIAAHHGLAPSSALASDLALRAPIIGTAPGALGAIQRGFGRNADPTSPDTTMCSYGLRDPIEEVDCAAALTARLLDQGLTALDIGILCPDDPAYAEHLHAAFQRNGIAVSDTATPAPRDDVAEALTLLLTILQGPVPAMALASLCLSPLMPWAQHTGRLMAREFAERGHSRTAKASWAPIFGQLEPVANANHLVARLSTLIPQLHQQPALKARLAELRSALPDQTIDWLALSRMAARRPTPTQAPTRMSDAVSLFPETALPWRPVRHLIVLGLAGRNWPRPAATNPVFTEGEIAHIASHTGLRLPSRQTALRAVWSCSDASFAPRQTPPRC